MSAALSSEGFCESSALLPSSPVNRPAQERTAPCPPSTSRSDHEHLLATSPASYGTMETHELRRTGSASVLAAHPTRRSSVAESPLADLLDPATSTNGFPEQQIRMRGAASATDQKNDTLDTPSAPGPPPQPTAQQKTQGSKNRKRWGGLVWELENKGAVARDHLAGERTFLAWLRTSLALASIGIAITQLFRLPSASTTTKSATPTSLPSSAAQLSSALSALATADPSLATSIVPILRAQQAQIDAAQAMVQDSTKYRKLGKPIGGTFIMLALLFLLLGIHRYFAIQLALMREPSQFPPSRRSVGLGSFCVGALILATFISILATQ
ncbi:hypothetical protein OF846_003985 [Rhodotorula toruloides]|nr:hypothetical protein OF846_003985 [Rhodotorula toruloides]